VPGGYGVPGQVTYPFLDSEAPVEAQQVPGEGECPVGPELRRIIGGGCLNPEEQERRRLGRERVAPT